MKQNEQENDWQQICKLVKLAIRSSLRRGINPAMFTLTLQCLCRSPFISYKEIHDFITMIQSLIDAGQDYSLLLKAGILTGQFPDYLSYKKNKSKQFQKTKRSQLIEEQLNVFKNKLGNQNAEIQYGVLYIPVDTRWVDRMCNMLYYAIRHEEVRNQYINYWKRLDSDQKKIFENFSPEKKDIFVGNHIEENRQNANAKIALLEIKKIIQLLFPGDNNSEKDKWHIDHKIFMGQTVIVISNKCNTDFQLIQVKNTNKFDCKKGVFPPFPQTLVVYDQYENEKLRFISIYQNHLFNLKGRIFTIKQELERYFIETHFGRTPNENEFDALYKRYYRFIKKAYPPVLQTGEETERDNKYNVRCETVLKPGRRNFFYLSHGKVEKKNSATLCYNSQKHTYCLYAGSLLTSKICDIPDCGIAEFITVNCKKNTLRRLNTGEYRVLKKIAIDSPSKAAWLVCGYKRNGLNCWKNSSGQTLRDYLMSIGHIGQKSINPRSKATVPADQM